MLPEPTTWRRPLVRLLLVVALQLATFGDYMEKEHLMYECNCSLQLFFTTTKTKHEGSRGTNSMAFWRQNGTLVGTAGNFWTAGESADVARFDMVASASTRWWTGSTDVAREAAHQEEEVQVPVDGGDFAINDCDATLEVQVPMGLNKALVDWHPTPKELQRGACMESTGYEDGQFGMGLDGNHCSDGLAASNRLYFVMEEHFTQETEPLYAGGMAMVYMPYLMDFMDFVDKAVERIFLFFEEFNFKMQCATWMKCLQAGVRQTYELMTVEHMWICWPLAATMLLMGSHLGLWKRIQTTSWSRATWSSTRLEMQKLRVKRAQARLQLRALVFISFAPCCQGMEGAGEQAFLQQMSMLAAAATNAANAAEKAIGLMSSQSATASSSSGAGLSGEGGLQAASRILKNPEVYNGDDPMAFAGWKFAFCSRLSFGDPRYQRCSDNLEKLAAGDPIPAYSDVEAELSVTLFAILTSYLKGRCVGLVKSMAKQKDGFKLWRALIQEFEPSSRQRSLAIAQSLSNYPAFTNSKTILEQILAYEQLVQQFEEVSSSVYPSELKIATLVKCSGQKLREYLQLTNGEQTTYAQLKETMLGYDKACRAWTPEAVLKSAQSTSYGDSGGPQPMEVDRVENKGKGKNKGKTKDKGKNWWNYGSFTG